MKFLFFFKAEDGIRGLVRSRGLGDVYKSQLRRRNDSRCVQASRLAGKALDRPRHADRGDHLAACLLYTSDAADERSSVDLGGRRII